MMAKTLGLALAAAIAAPAALNAKDFTLSDFSSEKRSLEARGLGPYPLEGVVERLLQSPRPEGWKPSGADKSLYLDLMEPVVANAAAWLDGNGALIDPVIKREWNQATPRFVSSAAALLAFGRLPELKEPAFKAMDRCSERLSAKEVKKASPDFWMRELATAYLCFQGVADEQRIAKWKANLSAVNPEAIYANVDPTRKKLEQIHNWAVYSSGGESLRQRFGIGANGKFLWGDEFFDVYMEPQFVHMTPYGMYRDPNDPITYDITTRLQFANALAFGYGGPLRGDLEEILRRGGLTMLLFTAPEGYVPFGGRSAQFNFQEAIAAALCELEARRYKNSSPALASAFKRQAHLSALSVRPWLTAKPPRHIKNLFPPDTLHGCDSYGQYSVYSLLASSFLGLAAIYADDSIPEGPAPSEIGGYAFSLGSESFHKAFASCQGSYLEIDSAADLNYDATGLGRIIFPELPALLPLGMSFSAKPHYSVAKGSKPAERPLALGPEWDSKGAVVRLAELSQGLKSEFSAPLQTPDLVKLRMDYGFKETRIAESCELAKNSLQISCSVEEGGAPVKPLRYLVPVLKTDGQRNFKADLAKGSLILSLDGKQLVETRWPEGAKASLSEQEQANRNGLYRLLTLEFPDGQAKLEILKLK